MSETETLRDAITEALSECRIDHLLDVGTGFHMTLAEVLTPPGQSIDVGEAIVRELADAAIEAMEKSR